MAQSTPGDRFRVIHILRSPVGGLFRHVRDLASGQAARGHDVGIIADASTGGERADTMLAEIAPALSLGVHRIAMRRNPHPSDLLVQRQIDCIAAGTNAQILHGHGSKGGLYARLPHLAPLPGRRKRLSVYTPHGGSLHFTPGTRGHVAFTLAERVLERGTDLFLFESAFAQARYETMIRRTKRLVRIVHNGLHGEEFMPVAPLPDATDLLFVGELRLLKGIDTLIEASLLIADATGRQPSLTLVGAGPDTQGLHDLVAARGIAESVRFPGPMPAREAFRLGRLMVVPSRMESFPYVVLEAAAAGMPLVATNVGGIPEIFGPDANRLVPPDQPAALAGAIRRAQADVIARETSLKASLRARVHENFTVDAMVETVLDAYRDALDARTARRRL
jgi:glycosyltransferase involved in cell wall biosynthesis